MEDKAITSDNLPGLYQSSDQASISAQNLYFSSLFIYLILLILAAYTAYASPENKNGALLSAFLFLATLGILVYLRVKRPDDIWYNGRAVAESVKTSSWRWMMRAEPYEDNPSIDAVSRTFIRHLQTILSQNKSLSQHLDANASCKDPISQEMKNCRALSINERLEVYKKGRIQDQLKFYSVKSKYNKRRAVFWFWVSVTIHIIAASMLLYRIANPSVSFPIEVVATAAGAALTWLQAKKHNELNSAYSLATVEIALINGTATSINSEHELSEFVVNTEAAFSREHTQWAAKKSD